MSSAPSRIEALRERIRDHDHKYYVLNQPTISDREYDQVFQELKQLEDQHPDLITSDSPTQRVGDSPIKGFAQVEHAAPMLSIDNTYNEQELRDFDKRVREGLEGAAYRYVVDPKIDGVAVSLVYESGLLRRAVTRGNGRVGDDVTVNMRTLPTVPLRLDGKNHPRFLDVRGEVYWPDRAFVKHNEKRIEEGEEPFANPRNAAAGTLKQLDPRQVAGRGLQFVAHGFAAIDPPAGSTHWEVCERLVKWGLPVSEHRTVAANIDEVSELTHVWHDKRFTLPYQTDGLVAKVDSLVQREILGATSRHPRWCIAYKFEAERAETRLIAVEYQVGKTGALTPVARLEPVVLAGTTVSNASLHNPMHIERLGLVVGDVVVIEKAGEIIPQIVEVLQEKREHDSQQIPTPHECPVCSGPVKFDELEPGMVGFRCENRDCPDAFNVVQRREPREACVKCGKQVSEVDHLPTLRCLNFNCPAQIKERLIHFASRNAMDIQGMGEAVVNTLISKKLVTRLQDIYHIGKWQDALVVEPGYGQRSVNHLVVGIEASKPRPLSQLLVGLSIPHVGVSTAQILAAAFGNMDSLRKAREREIMVALLEATPTKPAVKKVPLEIRLAKELHSFFQSEVGRRFVESLDKDSPFVEHLKRIPSKLLKKPQVFKARSQKLLEFFDSMAELAGATEQVICAVLRGERGVARDVFQFFQSASNSTLIDELLAVKLNMREQTVAVEDGPFSGMTVVVTGTLSTMGRKEAQDLIKNLGGKSSDSVSKSTNLLVAGENAGSKVEKARKLGIEIIDEKEFLRRAGASMNHMLTSRRILLGALSLGLLIRAALLVQAPPACSFWDHHEYVQWGRLMLDRGVTAVYEEKPPNVPTWDHEREIEGGARRDNQPFCNYPPLGVYVVYAHAKMLECISPKYISNTPLARIVFSSSSILGDLLTAIAAYCLVRRWNGPSAAAWTAAVIFLLPPMFLDSAWWTQTDSWITATLMCSLAAFIGGRPISAGVWWGLALALKAQAVLFAPVLVFAFLLHAYRRAVPKVVVVAIAVLNLLALPFWWHDGATWFERAYSSNLLDIYPETTLAAFNIWYADQLLGGDGYAGAVWLGISKDNWGRGLTFCGLLAIGIMLWRRLRSDEDRLLRFAGCTLLLAVMLPTRVHERYIVLCLPFLAVVAFHSVPRLGWALLPLIVGATFQITSHEWLPQSVQQWSKISAYVRAQYEDLRKALPPEEFDKLPTPDQRLEEGKAQFKAERSASGADVKEWSLTLLCLVSAGACIGLLLTHPGGGRMNADDTQTTPSRSKNPTRRAWPDQ